jgi:uncharacterized membrane protein
MFSFFDIIALIISIVALSKSSKLEKRVAELQRLLDKYQAKNEFNNSAEIAAPGKVETTAKPTQKTAQCSIAEDLMPEVEQKIAVFALEKTTRPQENSTSQNITTHAIQPESRLANISQRLISNLKQHWLVWAGGIALLIGVAYLMQAISDFIEFTPVMRISAAFVLSCLVVVLGQRMHRKESEQSDIGFAYVPAVISAAGCMGLYSTVILGYLLYDLIPPLISLSMMGVISIFTLTLYLRLGPLMAILGLLAGFSSPLWFSGESGHPLALTGYIGFIALAGLLLASYVKRSWLYPLVLVPFLLWLVAIIPSINTNDLMIWSLVFLPLAIYFVLVIPTMGWRFTHNYQSGIDAKTYRLDIATAAITTLIMYVFQDLDGVSDYLMINGLSLLLAWYPMINAGKPSKDFIAPTIGGIVLAIYSALTVYPNMVSVLTIMTLVAMNFSLLIFRTSIQYRYHPEDKRLALLVLVTPVVLTLIGWAAINPFNESYQLAWSLYSLAIIVTYGLKAPLFNTLTKQIYACLHIILAIVLGANFDGSNFTAWLAVQALCAAWQIKQNRYPPAFWAIKVIISAILLRFTLSMAIPSLLDGIFNYGGYWVLFAVTMLLLFKAYKCIQPISDSLSRWIIGTFAHLSVVTVVAQTHYWLITPNAPWYQFDATHALVYVCEAFAISAVYKYRSHGAQSTQWLYQRYSEVLFVFGYLLEVLLNTIYSPLFTDLVSGQDMPIINKLALGWLIPGLILLGMSKWKLLPNYIPKLVSDIVGFSLIALWLGFSIRQYWQPDSLELFITTSMAEQISYSVAGLIAGTVSTLYGVIKHKKNANLVGLSIFAVVAAKVVLVDTAELEGLFKALSYLLLGSVLVAFGWLFQKLRATVQVE